MFFFGGGGVFYQGYVDGAFNALTNIFYDFKRMMETQTFALLFIHICYFGLPFKDIVMFVMSLMKLVGIFMPKFFNGVYVGCYLTLGNLPSLTYYIAKYIF